MTKQNKKKNRSCWRMWWYVYKKYKLQSKGNQRGKGSSLPFSKGAFVWENPKTDHWSKITSITVHQRNRWIQSGKGVFGSSDAPWSKWSWTDQWSIFGFSNKKNTLRRRGNELSNLIGSLSSPDFPISAHGHGNVEITWVSALLFTKLCKRKTFFLLDKKVKEQKLSFKSRSLLQY